MIPVSFFNINAQQATTHKTSLMKLEATLDAAIAAGLYLLLFDSNVAPANGAVPLKAWPAAECGYKEFEEGELVFASGLYVALSTTYATYTAAGGGNLIDILNLEYVNPELPAGTQLASANNVKTLQVWADASGPKKLFRVEADNTGGALRYLMLFAYDNPQNGDKPIDQFTLKANKAYLGAGALQFGVNGRDVYSQDSTGAPHAGCTLMISDTPTTLTLAAANIAALKGEYK